MNIDQKISNELKILALEEINNGLIHIKKN